MSRRPRPVITHTPIERLRLALQQAVKARNEAKARYEAEPNNFTRKTLLAQQTLVDTIERDIDSRAQIRTPQLFHTPDF